MVRRILAHAKLERENCSRHTSPTLFLSTHSKCEHWAIAAESTTSVIRIEAWIRSVNRPTERSHPRDT